jgi:UrcA family protein
MTRRQSTASLLTVAVAIAAVSTPALATPLCVWANDERVSVIVHYQDAELQTPAGAAKLASRVRSAAFKVCGGSDPLIFMGAGFGRCQRTAIDRAVATLNAPLVADALGRETGAALAKR